MNDENPQPDDRSPTPVQKRGMRVTIIGQCFGCLATLALTNGILLVYLTRLGVASSRIMMYLSLPWLGNAILVLPSAYLADRYGKKRIGLAGMGVQIAGYVLLTVLSLFPVSWGEAVAAVAIVLFGAGSAMVGSSWYALLSPVVPEHLRGSFFGRLRFSWQLCGIIFGGLCASSLSSSETPISVYQVLVGLLALGLVIRVFFYVQVPELDRIGQVSGGFADALRISIRREGFMSFCSYVFLLSLFTAGCPIVFGLIEKDVVRMGDDLVVFMGTLLMIGSVIGYLVGGKAIDRFGTKPVFLICHFLYGGVTLAFIVRGLSGSAVNAYIGTLSFLFGFVSAGSSVAISTELLGLMPDENKALFSSVCTALQHCGIGLAGIIPGWAIEHGLLSPRWSLHGAELTSYDSILFAAGSMIILLVITLGLVPSVLRKSELIPS